MERERLERAVEAIPERSFAPGETLFEEADEGGDLYVLLSGAVRVLKRGRQVAVIDAPGAYFGEMSVLLGVPRTATVVAADESRLLVVPKEHLTEFFGNTPHLALRIARGLAERLARTTEALVGMWETVGAGAEQ
jgi:CRP-like cAMP-binding protein